MMFGFVRYAYVKEPTQLTLDAEMLLSYVGTFSFGEGEQNLVTFESNGSACQRTSLGARRCRSLPKASMSSALR
jgi:hypothetical protein